jgi:hypothetical protein
MAGYSQTMNAVLVAYKEVLPILAGGYRLESTNSLGERASTMAHFNRYNTFSTNRFTFLVQYYGKQLQNTIPPKLADYDELGA